MFGRKKRRAAPPEEVDPSNSEFAGFLAAGRARLAAADPEQAEQWLTAASHATDPGVLFEVGFSFAEIGATAKAMRVYERAAQAGHVDAMNNLGVLLKQADRWEEAERWLRAAADTGDRAALNNLGNVLRGLRRTDEAIDSYSRAARAGHVEAMLSLGQVLLSQGEVRAAKRWFRQAARAGHPAGELMLEVADRPGPSGPSAQPPGAGEPLTLPLDDPVAAADALRLRAQATSDPELLDMAVDFAAEVVAGSAAGSVDRALSAATLSVSLRTRAARTGSQADLSAAVAAGRAAVDAADACGQNRARCRTALATALLDAHQRGEAGHLAQAVQLNREIVTTLDVDDPEYPSALSNLTNVLFVAGAAEKDRDMLAEAVVTGREALSLRPERDRQRGRAAVALSQALMQFGLLTQAPAVLLEARQYAHEALADTPPDDPNRPVIENYAAMLDAALGSDGTP
ncbi:hypothetical protein Kisp01_24980 [Kineosporia sp. NBRC 101677]|uniref:tetratricopeptide repeat protein n=1 Tax=Kineosporia sp. NBRC 101677 TaxID=3032197 RepID=UPI0024A2384D|nr:tetratricopeptide repeat protein [Kineosporia sp. NBRC 101677]GLY15483.1 hypothetical protein Kisp01_24980 [Kineosporia sp. NBRC 101677]